MLRSSDSECGSPAAGFLIDPHNFIFGVSQSFLSAEYRWADPSCYADLIVPDAASHVTALRRK